MSLVKEATLPKKQDLFKLNLKSTSNCNVCQTSWVRSKSISIIILDLGPLDSQVMIRLAIVKWPKYVISEMWCLLGSTQSCEIHSGISQFPFVKGSILWAKIILLYLLSFCTNMLNLFNFQSIPFYSNVIWKKNIWLWFYPSQSVGMLQPFIYLFLVSEWSWLFKEELTMGMIEEIDDGDVEECPLPYKV